MITITDSAYTKLAELLANAATSNLKCRIQATRVGSIIEYEIGMDDTQSNSDTLIQQDNISVLIDASSMQYIAHVVVDYREDRHSAGFIVKSIPDPADIYFRGEK